MKQCTRCATTKPLEEFPNHKRSKDGKYYACRECKSSQDRESYLRHRERRRERAKEYYEENKEAINESSKKYYEENSASIYEKNRQWVLENPEKTLEHKRRYREANRESIRESSKEYSRRNLDRIRLSASRRRARLKALPDTLTYEETEALVALFNHSCAICGGDYEHLDHFIPIASGHGGTTIENVVPLCAQCNMSKGPKNPFVWARTLSSDSRERFNSLIKHLSGLNGIATVEDYEAHVYQCFK